MIYITTHHRAINFGAALQSYALQNTLKGMGYDSRLILLQEEKKKMKKIGFKGRILGVLQGLYKVSRKKEIKTGLKNFSFFCEKYHKTTEIYESFEALQKNPPKGDVYISGSDQVFNPVSLNPAFFLQFGEKDVKRISYAASVSVKEVPKEKEEAFQSYLECFDRVSIREKMSVPLVEEYYKKSVKVHVDPSYLVLEEKWKELSVESKKKPLKKPYILVYVLYRPSWLNAYLKKLKKETGYDIVTIQYSSYRNLYSTKTVRDAGPLEFLNLIRGAEMVISSSYHGCVFSTIFRKPFYAVVNPASPARIRSMLELFHLEDREISKETKADFKIDYSCFEEILPGEQTRAKEYLKEAIEG